MQVILSLFRSAKARMSSSDWCSETGKRGVDIDLVGGGDLVQHHLEGRPDPQEARRR